MTDFPELLARLRITAGLSKNALARRAQVNPAYVHRLEKGAHIRPSLPVLERLISALRVHGLTAEELRMAAGYCPHFVVSMSPADFREFYTLAINSKIRGEEVGRCPSGMV